MDSYKTSPTNEWCLKLHRAFECILHPEFRILDDSLILRLQDKINVLGLYACLGERIVFVISFRGSLFVRTKKVLGQYFRTNEFLVDSMFRT